MSATKAGSVGFMWCNQDAAKPVQGDGHGRSDDQSKTKKVRKHKGRRTAPKDRQGHQRHLLVVPQGCCYAYILGIGADGNISTEGSDVKGGPDQFQAKRYTIISVSQNIPQFLHKPDLQNRKMIKGIKDTRR
jgi:hypothetical protein